MIKPPVVLLTLSVVLMSLTGCAVTHSKKPVPVEVFWGNKTKVIEFLQSDKAQADRWYVEAIK
jgi:hypothetical protein